jgi:hypothetical protein
MPERTWANISAQESAVELDYASFCVRDRRVRRSPVDSVYLYIRSTVVLGTDVALGSNPALGRLLLLGFVSSIDDYFRRILSGVVEVCPLARRRASDKPVSFGALDYYEKEQAALALFENTTFASLKELKNQTANIAGINIDSASVGEAISKYEKLCHMRHAATHAGGLLNSRNARELGITVTGVAHEVLLSEAKLQTAASVCYSAVRAYNRWLFQGLIQSWIDQQVLSGKWATDKSLLESLFGLFHSKEDGVGPPSAYHVFLGIRAGVLAAAASKSSQRSARL